MHALKVALRASFPVAATLNQNRSPSPDLAMTVFANHMIELIVDLAEILAAPFCHCSLGVLK
jgi:hypothetical protein